MTDALIDLDNLSSWPAMVKSVVSEAVRRSDLSEHEATRIITPRLARQRVEEVLVRARIRLYHGTRLTDREVRAICSDGLAPASADLVRRRLAGAVEEGAITADEAALLETSHLGEDEWRTGRIFLATSRLALADPAFAAVTERWGGEMLHWDTDDHSRHRLTKVGHPYVLTVEVPIHDLLFLGLDLSQMLVAAALQWADRATVVAVLRAIRAHEILSIDRYAGVDG